AVASPFQRSSPGGFSILRLGRDWIDCTHGCAIPAHRDTAVSARGSVVSTRAAVPAHLRAALSGPGARVHAGGQGLWRMPDWPGARAWFSDHAGGHRYG